MEEILCRGKTRGQGQTFVECPLLLQWEEWTEGVSVIHEGELLTIHLHRSQNLEHVKIYVRLGLDFI